MKNILSLIVVALVACLFSVNNAYADFAPKKATPEEVSAAKTAWEDAIDATSNAENELALAQARADANPNDATLKVAVVEAEQKLKAAEEAEQKACSAYYALHQDINTVLGAICAFCVSTLLYAVFLAVGHWIGSFADPMVGLVFSGAVVLYALYTIVTNGIGGLYVHATVNTLALILAGYVHFTKTMAVA